jgi:hypothetical protein
LIFYGFGLLFLGTATITLQYDILEPLFGIRFWHGKFYLIFSLILDIAGVAMLGGLLYMMYRRGWLKLPKLDYARPDRSAGDADFDRPQYRREDWAFLWTLVGHRPHRLLARGRAAGVAQARPDVWDTRWWSPVGAVIAEALGLSASSARRRRRAAALGSGGSTGCSRSYSSRSSRSPRSSTSSPPPLR